MGCKELKCNTYVVLTPIKMRVNERIGLHVALVVGTAVLHMCMNQ